MRALIDRLNKRDPLSPEESAYLEKAFTPPRKVTSGRDIASEGARLKESTLLLSGLTGRYNTLRDGRRQITAIHVPGDFVDLHSFLVKEMDHGVVALTDCTVATVPHDSLKVITERFPHLTRVLWLSTLIDAAIHRRWVIMVGRLSAAASLAHLFCELHVRLEIVGLADGEGYDMPLTQAELSDVLGLSLVHVNRVVQELRREGLIAWRGRRLEVLDRDRLRAFAEFDPGYLHLDQPPA